MAFDTTGPRTPTIVAGPYAPRAVSHTHLDNTSILQLIAERFGTAGESYSSELLGRRQQGIASVSSVLDPAANNLEMCRFGATADQSVPSTTTNTLLRTAFDNALRELVSRHHTEALTKYPELRSLLKTLRAA